MSNKLKDKLLNIGKSERLSTLELWQAHLKALGRASQSRPTRDANPSFIGDVSEQSTSINHYPNPTS